MYVGGDQEERGAGAATDKSSAVALDPGGNVYVITSRVFDQIKCGRQGNLNQALPGVNAEFHRSCGQRQLQLQCRGRRQSGTVRCGGPPGGLRPTPALNITAAGSSAGRR